MMNTNKTTSKTAISRQLKGISYTAYKAIVTHEEKLASGKPAPIADLVAALTPCFTAYGIDTADEGKVMILLQRLVSFGVKDGQKGWKVLSVGTFRNVLKDWTDDTKGIGTARPVFSKNDKSDPTAKAEKPAKAKKLTKAELEAKVIELNTLVEKLTARTPAADAIAAD